MEIHCSALREVLARHLYIVKGVVECLDSCDDVHQRWQGNKTEPHSYPQGFIIENRESEREIESKTKRSRQSKTKSFQEREKNKTKKNINQ